MCLDIHKKFSTNETDRHITSPNRICVKTYIKSSQQMRLGMGMSAPGRVREGDECPQQGQGWGWSGQFRSGQQPIKFRLGQVRLGQVRLGQVRLGQVRLGQVRSGQVNNQSNLGQVRSGQVRSGQVNQSNFAKLLGT